MTIKWKDVEADERYQSLDGEQKAQIKADFWSKRVTESPEYASLDQEAKVRLHKDFFGVLPGELSAQAMPSEPSGRKVDRSGNGFVGDLAGSYVKGANALVAGAGWGLKAVGLDGVGQSVMNVGTKGMTYGEDMLSDEGVAASKKEFATLDSEKSALLDPRALVMMATESLPATIAPMGLVSAASRAVAKNAAKKAAAAGATKEAASEAAKAAGKKAAVTAGMVSEGAVVGGLTGQSTYDEVMRMSPDELSESSPAFVSEVEKNIEGGMAQEDAVAAAQEAVAMAAGRAAASVAAPVGMVTGRLGGKWMEGAIGDAPSKGIVREMRDGALVEAAQELPQSVAEQGGQNLGVKIYADGERGLAEGLGNAAVGGAVMGGGMGAVFGGLSHAGKPGADGGAKPGSAAPAPSDDELRAEADAVRSGATPETAAEDAEILAAIDAELKRRAENGAQGSRTNPDDSGPDGVDISRHEAGPAGGIAPPATAGQQGGAAQPAPGVAGQVQQPGAADPDAAQALEMQAQSLPGQPVAAGAPAPVSPLPGLSGVAARARERSAPADPAQAAPADAKVFSALRQRVSGGDAGLTPASVAGEFGIDEQKATKLLAAAQMANTKGLPSRGAPAPAAAPAILPQDAAPPAAQEVPPQAPPASIPAGMDDASIIDFREERRRALAERAAAGKPVDPVASPAAARQKAEQAAAPGADEDPVTLAKKALASHRAASPKKGQAKTWAAQEKALEEAVRQARSGQGKAQEVPATSGALDQPAPALQAESKPSKSGPPVVLQNRDRSSAASVSQMQNISAKPDYLRLSPSRSFADGAPVVFGDLPASAVVGRKETIATVKGDRIPAQYAVVESADLIASHNADGTPVSGYAEGQVGKLRAIAGNGRVAGLKLAHQRGRAAEYAAEMAADDAHGIPPEAIRGMREPVLVRVMPADRITPDIGDVSNTSGTSQLSAAEQAENDIRRIDLTGIDFDENGEVTEATAAQFVQAMPEAERSGLMDGKRPARAAYDRLNAAIFAKAYGNKELVRLYAQAADGEAKNVMRGLAMAAPHMARLDGAGALDIRDAVAEAAVMAINAGRKGEKLAQYLETTDPLVSRDSRSVAGMFAENARSSKAIGDRLSEAAKFAHDEASKSSEPDIFGEVAPKATADDVIKGIQDGTFQAGQGNLAEREGREPADRNVERQASEPRGARADAGRVEEGAAAGEEAGEEAGADAGADAGGLTLRAQEAPQQESSRPRRANIDLFGKTPEEEAQQRLADEQARRERQQDAQAERAGRMSDGPLFDGSQRQTDIEDKSDEREVGGVQARKPAYAAGQNRDEVDRRVPDLFAGITQPDTEGARRDQAAENFRVKAALVERRRLSVGSTKATSPADVASIVASIRKDATESFYTLGLDKNGNAVHVVRHSKGDLTGAGVYINVAVGDIASDPRVTAFYMVHNHPSGNVTPSDADRSITRALRKAVDGLGIAHLGHVVVGGSSYSMIDEDGNVMVSGRAIPPAARGKDHVKIVEREIRVRKSPIGIASSPDASRKLVASLHKDSETASGLLLLDSQNSVVGVLHMDAADMRNLRAGSRENRPARRVVSAMAGTNAGSVIAFTAKGEPAAGADEAINNVARLIRSQGGARILDGVYFDGANYVSLGASGKIERMGFDGPFFSLQPETKAAYEARIDELTAGGPAKRRGVKILDRADILDLLGHGDKPLHLVESTVGKKENGVVKHPGMTAEQWKKVPEWIENPVAVFRSQQPGGTRLVLIAPELVGGRPVRVIIEPNGDMGGMNVHVAVNAYEEGGTHITPVEKWVKAGDLMYLDQKESPAFSARSGLRLPRDVRQLRGYKASPTPGERSGLRLPGEVRQPRGYPHKVLTETDLFKYRQTNGNDGVPKASLSAAGKPVGLSRQAAQRLLNKHDASAKAVQSYAELPAEIRAEADRQGATPDSVKGVHWRGKSWVVADNVTADEVHRVALHEGMHGKLRQAYGREVESQMLLLASNLPGTGKASLRVMALAEDQGVDLSAYVRGLNKDTTKTDRQKLAILTEELLTHLEEGRVTATGRLRAYLQAVVGAIRQFLRKHGFAQFSEMGVTDLQHLLRQARDYGERIDLAGDAPAFMVAWHGTPHEFDAFSLEHIGKGEGVQAYGWGLYFAGKREVADYYRRALSRSKVQDAKDATLSIPASTAKEKYGIDPYTMVNIVSSKVREMRTSDAAAIAEALTEKGADKAWKTAGKALSAGDISIPGQQFHAGSLYRVDIPEDGKYLLWDRPLPEETVRKIAEHSVERGLVDDADEAFDMLTDVFDVSGSKMYMGLSEQLGGDEAASKFLNEIGIPGIKYLDGASRARPLNDIKREFLSELPEDSEISDVMSLIGTGRFSPTNEALLKALAADGWLGFDYPAQAISAALGSRISSFDPSPELLGAIGDAQNGGSYNYVIFDDAAIKILERTHGDAPLFSHTRPPVGKEDGAIAQPHKKEVGYKHEIRPLDQLLRDANTSLRLDNRGGGGIVPQEWTQPSRYAGEHGGQGGSSIQGATSPRAGREEQARLIAAAKEHGFFIGLGHPIFESLEAYKNVGGEEHDAYIVGESPNQVVIRTTVRGEFGNTSKYSPVEYIKRLEAYNQTFPSLQTRMIGVHEDADGNVSILTAQQFVPGEEFATDDELYAAMSANGWDRFGMDDYQYRHKDTGAVIWDAHTGNVLHIGDELFPIDVIVERTPGAGKSSDTPRFSLAASGHTPNLFLQDARYRADGKPWANRKNAEAAIKARGLEKTHRPVRDAAGWVLAKAPVPPKETRLRALQRKWASKFNRFRAIQDWLDKEGVSLSEAADVYGHESLMRGRQATKIEDFREKQVKPLMGRIANSSVKMADIADFLHAQHAEERNIQTEKATGRKNGSGMSTDEANKKLAEYRKNPELVKLANEFRAITDQTRQALLDSGIISQEQADAWRGAYQHYVPLKGGPGDTVLGGQGGATPGTFHRALGHEAREEGEWITENILRDHEFAIMQVEKNRLAKSLIKFALETGDLDLVTINQPEKRAVLKSGKAWQVTYKGQVADVFENQQDAEAAFHALAVKLNPADLAVSETTNPSVVYSARPQLADNETVAYVAGNKVRIQFNDPLMARQWNNLGEEQLNSFLQAGRALNNWFSRAYTGYNPQFLFTNVARDLIGGTINLTGEHGVMFAAKTLKNYPNAWAALIRHEAGGDKLIKQYRDDGGSIGAAYLSDLERIGADVEATYDEYRGVMQTVKHGGPARAATAAFNKLIHALTGYIELMNRVGENALRVSAYQTALDMKMSRHQASIIAKEATINFTRRGEQGAAIGSLYLFFNPAIQGTAVISKALATGKHRMEAQALVAGLMALGYLVARSFGGGDEDEWEKQSDYTKERNLLIWTGERYVKIPIPYGYGAFFSAGRYMAEYERGVMSAGDASLHLASTLISEFTLFGAAADPDGDIKNATFLLPTVAQIVAQPAINKTSFGTPIYPDDAFTADGVPDSQRMFRSTVGTHWEAIAQGLNTITGGDAVDAGWIDVSPESLKYLSRTFTGGAGTFVSDSFTLIRNVGAGVDDIESSEVPIVRSFMGSTNTLQGSRSRFYEARDEIKAASDRLKRAEKLLGTDKANQVRAEEGFLLELSGFVNAYSGQVKAIREEASSIQRQDLPIAERRQKLKALEVKEERLHDEFMETFKQRQRDERKGKVVAR